MYGKSVTNRSVNIIVVVVPNNIFISLMAETRENGLRVDDADEPIATGATGIIRPSSSCLSEVVPRHHGGLRKLSAIDFIVRRDDRGPDVVRHTTVADAAMSIIFFHPYISRYLVCLSFTLRFVINFHLISIIIITFNRNF